MAPHRAAFSDPRTSVPARGNFNRMLQGRKEMAHMPLTLDGLDVCIRLSLAVLAGVLIGLNRGESGKVAGLRTTLLVCLAACLAMLQVNVLLGQAGKTADSFIQLDLMRLPLG